MGASTGWAEVLDAGTKVVPWLAMLVALGSAHFARQSYRLNRQLADERTSNMAVDLDRLWFSRAEDGRRYGIAVLVTNRASVANSIGNAELIIDYALPSQHQIRLRLPYEETKPELPMRIDSYGSAAATLKFRLQLGILPSEAVIKSHALELTETSGSIHKIPIALISERRESDVSKENNGGAVSASV